MRNITITTQTMVTMRETWTATVPDDSETSDDALLGLIKSGWAELSAEEIEPYRHRWIVSVEHH